MSVCPKCNASVADDMKFCPSCGTPIPTPVEAPAEAPAAAPVFCPNCGEKNDPQFAFCQKCGSALNAAAPAPVETPAAPAVVPPVAPAAAAPVPPPVAPPVAPAAAAPKASADIVAQLKAVWAKLPKKLVAIVAGVMALVLILICILVPGGSKNKPGLVYMKDKEISFTYLNKVKPFEATSNLDDSDDDLLYYVQFSEDGKRMFYPDKIDDGFSLYYRDLNKDNTKADAAVKLASNVNSYSISKDGKRVFYMKGSERNLYYHNLKDSEKIASDVTSFYINDTGKILLYVSNDDEEESGSLYRQEIGSKKEATKIDSGISSRLWVSEDLSRIYYIKEGSLYYKNGNKEKEKIDGDVSRLVSYTEKGTGYYLKETSDEVALSDYVTDDMKDSDAAMAEPIAPDIADYQTQVENEWWGTTTETDWDAYNAARTAYNEARTAYNKKEARDRLRTQLAEEKITKENQSLYFFDGSKTTVISADINDIELSSPKNAVVAYTKFSQSSVEKVNLSELSSLSEIRNRVNAATSSSSDLYVALKEKEELLDTSSPDSFRLNPSGKKLYFLDDYSSEDDCGTLMEVDVSGSKLGSPNKVDDDVSSIRFRSGSDSLLYFKDVKNGSGDLYENGKSLATDVYVSSLTSLKDSKALVYLVDYSDSSRTGTLTIHTGKAKKIADDVARNFVVESEKSIAYLTDWSKDKNRGDAYLYNGSSKAVKIDTDVTAMIGLRQLQNLRNWQNSL